MSDNAKKDPTYELWTESEMEEYKKIPSFWQDFKGRMLEDPGIPIFSLLTVFALGAGMNQSFFQRNPKKANMYMTARVGFQGLAAGAIVWSIYKMMNRNKNGEKK